MKFERDLGQGIIKLVHEVCVMSFVCWPRLPV